VKSGMKKIKTKPKEGGAGNSRSQVVRLKTAKPRASWLSKLPPVREYYDKTKQFLAEVVRELKQTTWPNRKETLATTGVVLVISILIAIYLGLVDYALSHMVRILIR
jgi:preprotein translocase subunit SecE